MYSASTRAVLGAALLALAWPCGPALAQSIDANDFGSVRTDLPTTGSVSFSGDATGTGDTGSGIVSISGTFTADWDFAGQFGSFLLDLPDFSFSSPLTGSLETTDGILTGLISGIDGNSNIVNGSVTGFLANGPVNGLPTDFAGNFTIPDLSASGSFTSDDFVDAMSSVLRLNALADDDETTAEDEFPNIVLTEPSGNETETFDAFAGACAGAGTGSDLEADCNLVTALAPEDLAVALDAVTPDEVSAIGNTVQGSTSVQRQSITTRMTTVRTAGNQPRVSTQALTFGFAGARFSMADIVSDMQRRSVAADPFFAARDELAGRRLSAPALAGYRPVPRMLPEHWYFDSASNPPQPAEQRRVIYTDRADPKTEGVLAQAEGASEPGRFSGNEFGRLGFFVSGNVGFGDKNETTRESGYEVRIYNVTAGADYRLRDDLLVGGAFSYGTSDADFDDDGGEASTDSWGANVYASASRGPVFVDGLVGYSIGELETARKIVFPGISRTADGNADTRQFAVSLAAGYEIQHKALRITPRATFDYTDNKVDSFSESGAGSFNLSYDEQDFESAQAGAEIGVAYVTTQPVPGIGDTLLQLNARLAYKHEFADDDREVDIAYVSSPTSTFSVETDDPDRDFMEAGVGVGASFGGGLSAFADVGTEIGKSNERLTNVTLGVRYQVAF